MPIIAAACLVTKCIFTEVTILGKDQSIHCGALMFPMLDTFKKMIITLIHYAGKISHLKVFQNQVLFVTTHVFSIEAKCISMVVAQE